MRDLAEPWLGKYWSSTRADSGHRDGRIHGIQRTQGAVSTELQQSPHQAGGSAGAGAEGKGTAAFIEMVFCSAIERAILGLSIQSEQLCARTLQDKLTSQLPLSPQAASYEACRA